ncbi:MAG: type II toxin-antitoxin system VapC family toxin [Acetobacteraceae bacterium]|nr:type II toxin-antitoxin system VapC family toxin [Acetobacteraceae bacterium]MBV8522088.1 type II toxin-antitoxin system VapC family toxin [Acetobacteraceae bacterium]MBV8590070.1 type II toxin-antitoxin system VapC family toxin [Acetobacteraceae bacterium]
MSFVVDASIALAWCFEDEQTDAVLALLDRVTETGAVAPQLWPLEVLNGLLMAERRGRLTPALRERFAGLLRDLPVTIDDETASQAWDGAAPLADAEKLSLYDAAYLELSLRRRLPLATKDAGLAAAAERAGATLLRA